MIKAYHSRLFIVTDKVKRKLFFFLASISDTIEEDATVNY